jgi:DNA primase
LIFYFGRDLTGTRVKKYMSPDVPKQNILYGFDHMFEDTSEPLYVAEGWFDVFRLKGVAVLGNRMTPGQITWLNKSHRPKVVIPDRFGDGHLLAEQAIELGWSVSTPDIGECKDINEAMCKYGEFFTRLTIKKHTYEGFEALVRTQTYCEHEPRKSKKTS